MSYTKLDAIIDRANQVEHAVLTGDVEQLYAIADSFAEQDDMEQAHHFRKMARAIENTENYYDNQNN